MAMKIRKAVIPVAGLGTRFLPATKTVPKELLPIVDKPTLMYVAEEIAAAGISQVVLISGRNKGAIEDFFDTSYELQSVLAKKGNSEALRAVEDLLEKLTVISVRQHEASGLGHAVLCAEPVVGSEPFAVLLGDEITIAKPGKPSGIAQLMRAYEETGTSVVAVMEVPESDVNKYGIVKVSKTGPNLWSVHDVVEKPAADRAPSRLALPGRYVFDAEIFEDLKAVKPGRNGEIQLTDAMSALARRKGMLAMALDAHRFDAGDKLGYLIANVEVALTHPELGAAFGKYLKDRFAGD